MNGPKSRIVVIVVAVAALAIALVVGLQPRGPSEIIAVRSATPTVSRAGLAATDYTLVRLGSDPKSMSGDRVTFQELGGLATSVRLR